MPDEASKPRKLHRARAMPSVLTPHKIQSINTAATAYFYDTDNAIKQSTIA